jgi:hypothetical protein
MSFKCFKPLNFTIFKIVFFLPHLAQVALC